MILFIVVIAGAAGAVAKFVVIGNGGGVDDGDSGGGGTHGVAGIATFSFLLKNIVFFIILSRIKRIKSESSD